MTIANRLTLTRSCKSVILFVVNFIPFLLESRQKVNRFFIVGVMKSNLRHEAQEVLNNMKWVVVDVDEEKRLVGIILLAS